MQARKGSTDTDAEYSQGGWLEPRPGGFNPGNPLVAMVQEAGLASEPLWMATGNQVPTGTLQVWRVAVTTALPQRPVIHMHTHTHTQTQTQTHVHINIYTHIHTDTHTQAVLMNFKVWRLCDIKRVRKTAKSDYELRHSVRLSAWNNSAPTGRILIKFYNWAFFLKSVEIIQFFFKKSDKHNGHFTTARFHICDISLNYS